MDVLDLLQSHKYAEAIAEFRRRLAINPNDIGAADGLALALKAVEEYREALSLYESVGLHEQEKRLPVIRGQRDLPAALSVARTKLLSRWRLCGVLFHDGTRRRAQGAEQLCLVRMRECYGLENPLIEPEWYLARHEVEQTGKVT